MNRYYLDDSFLGPTMINGSEFHHLVHVMRKGVGDEIELVNGRGEMARAKIEKMQKSMASLSILDREKHPKPTPSLITAMAFLRMEKLDWAIEKTTELGADSILLFPGQYSEKKELSIHQIERLRQLSIAAMKHCGRLYLPTISILPSLDRILQTDGAILFGDVDPSAPMLEQIPDQSPILFITGPERGFSQPEEELLKQHARGVKLHINILRAETAPMVALTLLSRHWQ
jgi:16S rRNA (uracil1498-N3)-methyltransferase